MKYLIFAILLLLVVWIITQPLIIYAKRYLVNNIILASKKYLQKKTDEKSKKGEKSRCLIANSRADMSHLFDSTVFFEESGILIATKCPYIRKITMFLPKDRLTVSGYTRFSKLFCFFACIDEQDFAIINTNDENDHFSLYVPRPTWEMYVLRSSK